MSHDLKGREYAKTQDLKEGDVIEVDSDFTCIAEGQKRKVHKDKNGLYFSCGSGHHSLDGQLSDNGLYYIGIYNG